MQFRRNPIPTPRYSKGDARVGHLLKEQGKAALLRAALIGVPCDLGVALNGGRPGASQAPNEIRAGLYRLTPPADESQRFLALLEGVEDWGDIVLADSVEAIQEQVGEVVAECLRRNVLPILLGGGHEVGFGHFLGYVRVGREVSIVNVDAHLDVRPLIDGKGHSGSPFRQAIEHPSGVLKGYTVVGALRHVTSPEHADYLRSHGGIIHWGADGAYEGELIWPSGSTMLSLDIDAVDSAYAPGRSALAPDGMRSQVLLHLAEEAGRRAEVASMDIVEVNPSFDDDNRTSRLAGLAVWRFLKGLSER